MCKTLPINSVRNIFRCNHRAKYYRHKATQQNRQSLYVFTCFDNMLRCIILWRQYFTLWSHRIKFVSYLIGAFCTNSTIFVRLRLQNDEREVDINRVWKSVFQSVFLTMVDVNKSVYQLDTSRSIRKQFRRLTTMLYSSPWCFVSLSLTTWFSQVCNINYSLM